MTWKKLEEKEKKRKRIQCFKEGKRNTEFFHTYFAARLKKNAISFFKDHNNLYSNLLQPDHTEMERELMTVILKL